MWRNPTVILVKLAEWADNRRLFLSNIQRGVVWSEDDINYFADSILRGYAGRKAKRLCRIYNGDSALCFVHYPA